MSKDIETNSERGLQLTRTAQDFRQKYTYFLLTAVGAAIGFTVTQTKESILHWALIPLGLAVVSWSWSFFAGCRYLHHMSIVLYTNARIYRIAAGTDAAGNLDEKRKAELIKDLREKAFDPAEKGSERAYKYQLATFLLGAIFFLTWHILSMWLRSQPVNP
ncbi:hypothetical protein [Achromobacter marplatensis]|jgi:hypothetical protein|uniref:hypothetical protein n=1 Tax=Achromobacter marplatensis TaxID=470868 RepID=UPI003D059A80